MSRVLVASIFALAVLAPTTTALAHDPSPDTTLTVNPIALSDGFINFELESAPLPFLSLYGSVAFLVWDGIWDSRDETTFAFGPEFGARIFPFGRAPVGVWAGPFFGIGLVEIDSAHGQASTVGTWAGGMVGASAILFEVFALSGGIGLAYHDLAADMEGSRVGYYGWSPRLRLAAGIAF